MMSWLSAAMGRRQYQLMPPTRLLISLIHLRKHVNEIALLFNRFYVHILFAAWIVEIQSNRSQNEAWYWQYQSAFMEAYADG